MKNQFTPGPWHVNTLETVPFTVHACRGHVATVSAGTMNEVSADEIEANAALIAAGPDLFAALESALTEMDAFQKYWTSPKMGMKRGTSQAQEQARAAIAKAKGDA